MWVKSNDCESFQAARSLIREEGLLVGGSSGAILSSALKVAKDLPEDKRVVVLLPDGIRNYMTKFVSDYWMESRGFIVSWIRNLIFVFLRGLKRKLSIPRLKHLMFKFELIYKFLNI